MRADMYPWGNGARLRTEALASVWPAPPIYFPVAAPPSPQGLYAGYFADRQNRFYLRSMRRSGVYLGDLSPIVLWIGNGNGWEWGDGFCP
jgi:hypothetical protein